MLGNKELIGHFGIGGLLQYWNEVGKKYSIDSSDFDIAWLHNPFFMRRNPFERSISTIHTTYRGSVENRIRPIAYKLVAKVIESYCYRRLPYDTRFITVSPSVSCELKGIGLCAAQVRYIQTGVDTQRFAPASDKASLRRRLGIQQEGTILLAVGRLTPSKQPLELIKAFSLVAKKNSDVTLVIVGRGELLERTRELAGRLCPGRALFMGYVDKNDLPDIYASADYYVMSSAYEGQPATLLEAMAAGLPCIVSNIPSLEIVHEAECGISVDFKDVQRAAKATGDYISVDNSKHARSARDYVIRNHTWRVVAEKYLDEFERAVHN
jgi:glycosyltransferase involved in cell wall biosynthesis